MTKSKFFLPTILFCFAIILFFAFRLINLNIIPVFVDEAIYVRWSQVMRSEPTLRFLPLSDGKQPLFMWLTIPFLKFVSDPLIAGRMVSIFSGLGSLIGIGLLTWYLFKKITISAISVLLYAVIPFTVFFDRMALADSLLNMFGIWTLIFSVLFAKSKRLDHAMILGFFLGGGLITKSPAIIFYLWFVLALVILGNLSKISRSNIKDLVLGIIAILFISQAINSVLRLGPGFSQIGARNADYVFTIKEVLGHPFNPLIGNLRSTTSWLWLLLTPPVFITVFLGLLNKKRLPEKIFILLICLAPLFAQGLIAKVYTTRYILFASTPLLVLAASGIYCLLNRKQLLLKLTAIAAIFTPLFISFIYITNPEKAPMSYDMRSGYLEEWTAGWGNKEITDYAIDLASKGERVVIFTEGYFGTMPDGLQIYTEGHKNITVVGSPPEVSRIPDGLLNSDKTNKNFLVVNKSRNHLNTADLSKLTLVKEFPKPVRKDGTRQVLQFFELK